MTDVESVSGASRRCVSGVGAGVGDWLGAAVGICDGAALGIAVGNGVVVVGVGVGAELGEKVATVTEPTVASPIESRRPSASAAK